MTGLKKKKNLRHAAIKLEKKPKPIMHDSLCDWPVSYFGFTYASINSSGAHPPRATVGHLLMLSVPGLGHLQFYRSPGGWALAYPGTSPGYLTRVFSKFIGKDEAFAKDWLVHQCSP